MSIQPITPSQVPPGMLDALAEDMLIEAYGVPNAMRYGRPDTELVGHAVAALAYAESLAQQLQQARWPLIAEALRHGATARQLATAAGLTTVELEVGLAAWTVSRHHTVNTLCPWCGTTGLHTGSDLSEPSDWCPSHLPPKPWRIAECVDCGHEFDPDSSPHLDRCWQCAERADAEAETLIGGLR